jgi:protein-tyrosine-phosphatase
MPADRAERVAIAVTRRVAPFADRLLRIPPVRRRLRRRALEAWLGTDAPLLVCTGNINRSPVAEALARRRPGSRATSSGFFPVSDRPSSAQAVEAAAAVGVTLEEHRSRVTSRGELDEAAAIFVFELEHVTQVAFTDPRALARTHLLGVLAPAGPLSIDDPHGRPASVYRSAFERVRESIDAADSDR